MNDTDNLALALVLNNLADKGGGSESSVINEVKVNGVALPIENKSVNIDLSDYVEKEDGKELVSAEDIAQIATNKAGIETLNGTGEGSVDKKIADTLSEQTLPNLLLPQIKQQCIHQILRPPHLTLFTW